MPYLFIGIPLMMALDGAWMFFAPDSAWNWREAWARREGLVVQKPEDWTQRRRREGLIYMVGGSVLAIAMAVYLRYL